MAMILVLLAIVSGVALAIMVVVKVRASRIRRTVASPYGMLVGPTDAELRRTREVHAESLQVVGRWRENCPSCSGTGYVLGAEGRRLGIQCGRCQGRGDIFTQGRV